jgi:hypothetical protein
MKLIGKAGNINKTAQESTMIRVFLVKLAKTLRFMYSLFIGIQLAYLAYAEFIRIKAMLSFIVNNSKTIRIKDHPN